MHTDLSDTPLMGLRWLLATVLVLLVVVSAVYVGSGMYAAKRLIYDLVNASSNRDHPDLVVLSGLLPRPTAKPPHWHGAGSAYLKQVWPQVYANDDPLALLRLSMLQSDQSPKNHYARYFSHYDIVTGSPDQAIVISLKRQGFVQWQPYRVCVERAQPSLDLMICPSDNR